MSLTCNERICQSADLLKNGMPYDVKGSLYDVIVSIARAYIPTYDFCGQLYEHNQVFNDPQGMLYDVKCSLYDVMVSIARANVNFASIFTRD